MFYVPQEVLRCLLWPHSLFLFSFFLWLYAPSCPLVCSRLAPFTLFDINDLICDGWLWRAMSRAQESVQRVLGGCSKDINHRLPSMRSFRRGGGCRRAVPEPSVRCIAFGDDEPPAKETPWDDVEG
ncbi:hypothetical protein CPC08DRAFT_338252 [Agrocybe pediades]|nr:hypothetical protein CPC08DRAFT_338252 [Agrocybe pediades]